MTNLVLFGLDCRFTRGVLAALAQQDIRPMLLILPGPPGSPLLDVRRSILAAPGRTLLMASPTTSASPAFQPIQDLAETTVRVGSPRDPEVADRIAAVHPDAIAVACYHQRVPHSITALAPLAVNVHPSLLPHHRGPDPLFWTFHAGDAESGVTLHTLALQLDAGDMLVQESMSIPHDADESYVESELAQRGGNLLASLLRVGSQSGTAQDETQANYESWPTPDDLHVTPDWSIERAWRCLHGLRQRHLPFTADIDGTTVVIEAALRTVSDAGAESSDQPPLQDDERALSLRDGWLIVRVRSD